MNEIRWTIDELQNARTRMDRVKEVMGRDEEVKSRRSTYLRRAVNIDQNHQYVSCIITNIQSKQKSQHKELSYWVAN